MFKKVTLVAAVIAIVVGIGGTAAFADEGTGSCPATYSEDYGTYVQGFCDGRINAFDMTQTAAVYYDYQTVPSLYPVTDDEGNVSYLDSTTKVVSGVEVWVIDGDGVGQPALSVPVATINAAIARGADSVIAQGNGVSLNYSAWGALWISAPGGYTFTWEPSW